MSGGITVVLYPSRCIKLAVFFEPNAEGSLRHPNVGVVGVVVTRDMVDSAAQFPFGGFQAESTFHKQRPGLPAAIHLWSDHSATTTI